MARGKKPRSGHRPRAAPRSSGRARLEAEFPTLPLIWLDTQESEGEVFFARAADFPASGRKKNRQ